MLAGVMSCSPAANGARVCIAMTVLTFTHTCTCVYCLANAIPGDPALDAVDNLVGNMPDFKMGFNPSDPDSVVTGDKLDRLALVAALGRVVTSKPEDADNFRGETVYVNANTLLGLFFVCPVSFFRVDVARISHHYVSHSLHVHHIAIPRTQPTRVKNGMKSARMRCWP